MSTLSYNFLNKLNFENLDFSSFNLDNNFNSISSMITDGSLFPFFVLEIMLVALKLLEKI
jgi:hypothetical protein